MCLFGIRMLTKALKTAFPERRPDGEDNESFPSEHAAQCVAAALIIQREYGPVSGAMSAALAAAVSLSRVEGKKHHPRDVIAGALVGASTVWGAIRFRRTVEHRLERLV
jgi:membrane-associated phospholipid phosphatase